MRAEALSGLELLALLALAFILIHARWLPELRRLWAAPAESADHWPRLREAWIVWLAQGFGAGCAPVAPGTVGSLVGLLWTWVLMQTGNFWAYGLGTLLGLAISVAACGAAERSLRQHDPPSVVLDEIAAMPICFLSWVGLAWFRYGAMPPAAGLFEARGVWAAAGLFLLFRLGDVAKPWPIRDLQKLPAGWGITADDVLAAVYVALISYPVMSPWLRS